MSSPAGRPETAGGPAQGGSKVSGFLAESLAREIVDGVVAPRLERSFVPALRWLAAINKAHLVMLREQGLIDGGVAVRLLAQVDALEKEGPAAFSLDPEREDPWFNYEAELTRRLGPEAGWLHLARSRNDLKATQDRLRCRELAESLLQGSLALREVLLDRGEAEAGTVMPGYTHLQHAQPMTFGWYLLGVEAALARDADRIEDAVARLDRCPLGAGAFAGTRFAIRRERTAELLGFAGPQPHALDAVANPDGLVELTSAALQLAMTVGRMSQDFYLWSTYEFGMVAFPDRVASTSSIMPQKKNLTVLENLKARPAVLLGALSTAVAALRGTPFGHSQEVSIEAGRWAWDALAELDAMLPAARVVVESVAPRVERMRRLAGENFATATALADLLSARHGLPFRDAHHVTGRYVRLVLDGADPQAALREAFAEQTAERLEGAEALLAEALDPVGMLEDMAGVGPSLRETAGLVDQGRVRLASAERAAQGRRERRAKAARSLAEACSALEETGRPERPT